MRRLSADELNQAVSAHTSGDGRVAVFTDGLLVLSDKVQVLERVADMLNQVESADSPVWCVQLYLLALGDSDIRELGLENTPSLDLAAAFAAGAGSGVDGTAKAAAGLSSALRVAAERSSSKVVGQPCFLLSDGQESAFKRVRRYPYQSSQLGYEGRVSSQQFEFLDVGLTVTVRVRERGQRSALLAVDCEISDSDGERLGVPIRVSDEYHTSAVVESGGVYLLGSLERSERKEKGMTLLYWGSRSETAGQVLYVWATAKSIQGAMVDGPTARVSARNPAVGSVERLPLVEGEGV